MNIFNKITKIKFDQNATTNKGFTLIELLVSIAIIALLSSIVIGSVSRAKIRAQYSTVASQMLEMKKALEIYRTTTGYYPYENAYFNDFYIMVQSPTYVGDQMTSFFQNPVSYNDRVTGLERISAPFMNKYISSVPKPAGFPNNYFQFSRTYYMADEQALESDHEMGYLCGTKPIKKYIIYYYDPLIPIYASDFPIPMLDGDPHQRCLTAD